MKWKLPIVVLSLLAAVVVPGCSAKKKLSAEEYFTNATKDFDQGAYQLAIEQYRELLDQFPFSDHGEDAELKIAHAHLLANNLAEAIAAFTDFQRRHPTSPHLPFVGYALGLCYKRQMNTIDRDQSAAQNAHNYFATVAQQYPNSPFAELAREQLAQCRQSLAGHELYIADFYAKRDNRKAEEMRLLNLLGRYDDTDTAADALAQLARLYRRQKDPDRALLADAALAQHYPHSERADAARRRLKRLGKQDLLAADDPLPRLLVGIPRGRDTAFAPPIQVPGLDAPRSRSAAPSGVPALAPPVPYGRAGRY